MTESTAPESFTQGPTDVELLEQTLAQNLDDTARRFADRAALLECGPDGDPATGRTWTYGQLREESVTVAKALMAAGYEAGDRIGMWSPNVAEWVSLLYGAARAGVILVNLNPAYRAHELTYVVEQCDMRGLVVACADARMDPPATARAVARESAPHLRQLIMLPAGSGEDAYAHVQDGDVAGRHAADPVAEGTWAAFLAGAARVSDEDLAVREAATRPADPVNLQYTSGTTGFPKGVTLTHRNVLNNGFHIGELLGYTEEDTVVIPVPFFHCFGMVIGVIAAVSHGTVSVIPGRAFHPLDSLTAAAATRATTAEARGACTSRIERSHSASLCRRRR